MASTKNRMNFEFIKYQACGNDFILRDEIAHAAIPERARGRLAKLLCQRNFYIGADGLIFIVPSKIVVAKMRLFDRDGPEADMCGNGLRCAAAYLCQKLGRDQLLIETNDGAKEIERRNDHYRVNMGRLRYRMDELRNYFEYDLPAKEPLLDKLISFPELGEIEVSIVNTGEPHVVIFTDQLDRLSLEPYGRNITHNRDLFPHYINVDLAQVVDDKINIRTYERGVFKETLACGTGATAAAAVARLTGRIDHQAEQVKVITRGGEIIIEPGEPLYMTGPATKVYRGEIEVACE
ncbi:diaminopimelate epimerase [Candidatus Acetothermia bacterium]|nr:diaminopimelate epimerase [Candidatus Acetothermia bacterium]